MLASTIIPLHPLAIAGFVSLMVNALALVPVGRTDGGRISMALFGRSGTQGLTLLTLATLFIVGFSGSDLLLFYFGFLVLAQLELEIPLRNEIDDVGVPEVALASLAGFLVILTLVPM
jgi:membrane-associated protease RseP (regulator of RpoE activity)